MNKKKRIVAVMTSICLLVIVGIKVPMWLSSTGMDRGENKEEIPAPVETEPSVESLEAAEIDEEPRPKPELPEIEVSPELLPEKDGPKEELISEEPKTESSTSEMGELLDGVRDIDEDWVLRELEEHQDEIEQEDLEEGLIILNKIDANYLYEMSEDGFTDEEKAAAEAFLHAELPEEDVQAIWGLIHKYMELVD